MLSDEDVDVVDIDKEAQRRLRVGGTRVEDEARETTAAVAEARRLSVEAVSLQLACADGKRVGRRRLQGAWGGRGHQRLFYSK